MNIIGPMIQFVQQMRIFHWQTDSYAQHKAFGKAYDEIDELVDTFVETFMGKFGRAKPTVTYQITLKSLTSPTVVDEVLNSFIAYLNEMTDHAEITSDLLNIRDSILGEVHHLKYLLSLK
jgi:DNA-binding ferritin-like protein